MKTTRAIPDDNDRYSKVSKIRSRLIDVDAEGRTESSSQGYCAKKIVNLITGMDSVEKS